MSVFIRILIFCFVLAFSAGHSQNIDSLNQLWKNEKIADSTRLKANYEIAWYYLFNNPDTAFVVSGIGYDYAVTKNLILWQAKAKKVQGVSWYFRSNFKKAIRYYLESLRLYKTINNLEGESNIYNNLGGIYHEQGNFKKAIEYHLRSMLISQKRNDQSNVASSLNNVGIIYHDQGKYLQAIDYLMHSLKIREKLNEKEGVSASYSNLGYVYSELGDNKKSIEYHQKSYAILIKSGNQRGVATELTHIGINYNKLGKYNDALKKFRKAISINSEMEEKAPLSIAYGNMAQTYTNLEKFDSAYYYLFKSLSIKKEIGDKRGEAINYITLSSIALKTGEINNAIKWGLEGMKTLEETDAPPVKKDLSELLYKAYRKKGNINNALKYFEQFVILQDSLMNFDRKKEILQREFQFQYEKKIAADSIKHFRDEELKNSKQNAILARESTQRKALLGGLTFLFIALVFVLNRFRVASRQKKIIVLQKLEVDAKNKEIMDSIYYAEKIQNALIKEDGKINPLLPAHFILFKPKDIVSGDFYWIHTKENFAYIAAADCTGHGVPGAFLTMLGTSFLNEINATEKTLSPADILNLLREKIIRELAQTGEEGTTKDGMDISLARIDKNTNELQWAGANNPLWIVKKKRENFNAKIEEQKTLNELIEIKPDKQPIGFHHSAKPFTNHIIQLEKKDTVYLFTDGYADQFGGRDGKKYKYSRLKEKLMSIVEFSPSQQKQALETEFNSWKTGFEQLDDVCIIGFLIY